ncbi:MAG: lytic transglycosylase domain-containing protein [Candidatus Eremiobacteraeota bacterium]|nr:lytic transglycosylase domain-containing protein [Candidatus Eremiobacteraeota bacterium]
MRFLCIQTSAIVCAFTVLFGCAPSTSDFKRERNVALPRLDRALNIALTWPAPSHVDALVGARIFEDGPPVSYPEIAITRAILRTNPRISAMGALMLAQATEASARANGLPTEFLAATLLQESAYDPYALSAAGAVGIAQFELETAAQAGVNPYDPFDAIDGAGRLLGRYVARYAGRYPEPFVAALAAYNAGPQSVSGYDGVPPYEETRQYIDDIFERWARIASYERPRTGFAVGRLKARK